MVDDVRYWHATDGQITESNERFKHGTSSLKWEWSSGDAALTFTNPEVFRAIKWGNNKCFVFWLYNDEQGIVDENNPSQPLQIDFLTATDSKPIAHIWYHVNFHGWRPLGLRYALIPQFKGSLVRIHGVRFSPPSNMSSGTLFFNAMNFDFTHNVGPQPDYQQPWATPNLIKRLNDDPSKWLFTPNNIFYNRPWLQESQVSANEDDVTKIKDRWISNLPYRTWSPSAKPEPFSKLKEAAEKYGFTSDGISNVPLGKGFYSPSNALDIQPFLLGPLKRTATSYQCYRHSGNVESEDARNTLTLLLQLCDYLIEQGWAEGNGNMEGHLDIGTGEN